MRRWLRIRITAVALAAGHFAAHADSAARAVLVVEAQLRIAADVQRISHEAAVEACVPVRLMVFDDCTGSTPAHRGAPMREDQVLEMVELLRACGSLLHRWRRRRLIRRRESRPRP
jgi:hypothetical protein